MNHQYHRSGRFAGKRQAARRRGRHGEIRYPHRRHDGDVQGPDRQPDGFDAAGDGVKFLSLP